MYVTHGSDIGLVRTNNEDSYVCLESNIFAVADGMGGHVGGEVASKLLIEEVRSSLPGLLDANCDEDTLKETIFKANTVIFEKAAEDEALAGMGTTASVAVVREDKVVWAHIGDSRIYLMHDGVLNQITTDHSLVEMLLENGTITAEEALHHPQKNVLTRAAGTSKEIAVDTGSFTVEAGDELLLATDGLTNMIEDQALKNVLLDKNIENKADCLIKMALKNGGLDNITAIVVEF